MKEDTKEYKFLKPHRYSIDGTTMVNSFVGDVVALTDFYSGSFCKQGICELVKPAVEKKVVEPENKMLEVEKETKATKPTFKKKANIKKK